MKKKDYAEELEKIVDNTKYINVEVEDEMKKSFIAYAMAVNVSRAIPDVRDGLKPVHRRIIYSMNEQGFTYDKPFHKSAKVVGDVLANYHPHGDSSVYDALVRLAQDFSIRCPLVDGHGNFGSVDGDPAAAYRYTEARLSKIANEMLRDIDKETVDFYPNFDDTTMQPTVLPSRFPNLLVNGSDGIAVGMATNIPPHNLGEVIDGVIAMMDNPNITSEELMQYIVGPDFPTGGIIMGKNGIIQAYTTGRGPIILRARTEIEEHDNGKSRIIVSEIPYQVNKAKLIEQIANMVKEKRIEGISDLKDESDRRGMRIVIDIKKDAQPQVVLNYLFKHTQLQVTVGTIFLALVNGQPKVLPLRDIIYHYLEHQKDVVTRRTKYELEKARERKHILDGLLIAQENIDEVIAVIKNSSEKNEAVLNLMSKFGLSEKQALAILDMKLARLTNLEVHKIRDEIASLEATIAELSAILADSHKLINLIRAEITEIKAKYNTPRRTTIAPVYDDIDFEDLIPRQDVVISMTNLGYIKQIPVKEYHAQNRGGVGVTAHKTKEEDWVTTMLVANSHDDLMFFTNYGKVYVLKAYEIPEAQRSAKGRAIVNLLPLESEEKVSAIISRNENSEGYILLATKDGLIKRTPLSEFDSIRKNGKIAITLREGDKLAKVCFTSGKDNILLGATSGKCICFNEEHIRISGRTSMGVRSMRLDSNEEVIDLTILKENEEILTITTNGYGKRTPVEDYRVQGRGGKGTKAGAFNDKTGGLVCLHSVSSDKDVLIITDAGLVIRTSVQNIRLIGRVTSGVKLMKIGDKARIVSIAIVDHEEEPKEEDATEVIIDPATPTKEVNQTESTETVTTQE